MLNKLKTHPRFYELIDARKEIKAVDCAYSQRLVSGRYFDTEKDIFSAALYEHNHSSDFELTKNDVRDIKAGRICEALLIKIENDLGVLDNNPAYYHDSEVIDFDIDIPVADDFALLNMFDALCDDLRAISPLSMVVLILMLVSLLNSYTVTLYAGFLIMIAVVNVFLMWIKSIKPIILLQ